MLDKQVQRYPRRAVSPMGSQVECKIHQNAEKSFFCIENSSSGRKPQTIGDRTSRIVVKSRWLWFVNDIVRYTGRLLTHTPFSSPKRKMTCIHSELLAHRIPHRWNTLLGYLFLTPKMRKVMCMKGNMLGVLIDFFLFFRIAIYNFECQLCKIKIMKMWFCFLAESATPAWPASSLWSRWSGLKGLALVRTSYDGDDDGDGK